ncbi:hypothetical protein Dsin_005883 [Dipteronia sinensis]|uniref:Uncharacterized protein n=1 Tax=Dipteronia sinensis TaxID=43782 RepID=A0AAE0AXF2_9ROSI|nr:hypothetical protein Dsin_005883 [Dipteronia sinensis]
MILIISENIFTLASWARFITFIFLLFLLASPLEIAFKAQRDEVKRLLSQTFSSDRNSLVYNPEPIASMAYHELPGDDACQVKASFDENIIQNEEDMNLQLATCSIHS